MTGLRQEFLSGDRLDDVLIFIGEGELSDSGLAEHGEQCDGGVVLVLDGETGRTVFERATGVEAMTFANSAMNTDGTIERDCLGGACPSGQPNADHQVRFLLAFTEAKNPDVGGIYAEGDVLHAYATCACGTTYTDKWVIDADAASPHRFE